MMPQRDDRPKRTAAAIANIQMGISNVNPNDSFKA
jgi:hypothetical protein